MTYTARHVSRTATNPNLLFDCLHRLLRQLFTLVEFHEQHHTFVFLVFSHLTNYEAVNYPLNAVTIGSRDWPGKARVKHIVDFGGSKPDATRIPKSKDRQSVQLSEEKKISGFERRTRGSTGPKNWKLTIRRRFYQASQDLRSCPSSIPLVARDPRGLSK